MVQLQCHKTESLWVSGFVLSYLMPKRDRLALKQLILSSQRASSSLVLIEIRKLGTTGAISNLKQIY